MRLLSLSGSAFSSLWFRVVENRCEVNRFRGLAVYVRDGFSAYKQRVMGVNFVKSYLSGLIIVIIIFMCLTYAESTSIG